MIPCPLCEEMRDETAAWEPCPTCCVIHCGCHAMEVCAEEAEEAAKRRHVLVEVALYLAVAVLFALCVLAVMR